MTLLSVFVVAALFAHFSVLALLGWASRRLLDRPNERSSHKTPVPRGGGLGIAIVTMTIWIVGGIYRHDTRWLTEAGLVAAIAGLGLWDDIAPLPARVRLGVQTIAALVTCLIWGTFADVEVPLLGSVHLGAVGTALAVLWLVGLLNAYNFMDGIDGIAAIQGVAAACAWLLIGLEINSAGLAWIGVAIAGACIGFLRHNWAPAKIFMGDVGSTVLGYQFAVFPLLAGSLAPEPLRPRFACVALLTVWPFVFDATFTFVRRLLRRENVLAAHCSHLYQRCTRAGWTHRQVSTLYGVLAFACGAAACLWATPDSSPWSGPAVLASLALVPVAELTTTLRLEREHHLRSALASGEK